MDGSPDRRPSRLLRLAFAFYLALAVAGLVGLGWVRQGPLPLALFLVPAQLPADLALGLAAAALLAGVWELGRRHLSAARELEARLAEVLGGVGRDEALALALLSGLAEETLFRGALQSGLGWAAATALFALLHSGPQRAMRLWGLFALAAGALFGGLVAWRGTLAPAVIAHVGVNALNLLRLSYRRGPAARG